MKRIIPVTCLFIISFHQIIASERSSESRTIHEWKIGGTYHRGSTISHNALLEPIIERRAVAGEFFISKQTYGKHAWNAFFNYPEYGISYTFFDVGCPSYVGTVQSLYPYLNFYFFDPNDPLNLQLRTGVGVAYVDKIYNVQTNRLNHAFSTHLNVVLSAQLKLSCRISNSLSLSGGAGITHFSNGAYQMPNLGMNTFSFIFGITQSFGKENAFRSYANNINKKNKNWDLSVYLLGGIKEINPIGGRKYFASDFNFELTKKHLQYTRFGISFDATYDESEYDCIIFQSLPAVDRLKTTRLGVSGGYGWMFGDFLVDLYFGTYLYQENPLYGKVYQRTSLRYSLSDRVKLSLAFRNHKGKADFIGLGLGFRLTK